MKLEPKTLDEHRDYLHQMVRLKLWFLWHWLRAHPDEPFANVIRNRVDIYRKTDINAGPMNPKTLAFDDPRWVALETATQALYARRKDDPGAEAFEAEAFALFRPTVDARAQRDFEEPPYVLNYQCGSLRYDAPAPGRPKHVSIHIANALRPRSLFDDRRHLPECLFDLMDKTTREFGAESLGTFTWLNSLPRWLELFPPEWRASLGPEDRNVQWHFGWWGQYINARGTFNEKYGTRLRQTGEFPCWPRYAECRFDALRPYLKAYLAG